jgi:hypothetical protein
VTLIFTFTPSLRLFVNCAAAKDVAAFMFAMSVELRPALRNVESGSKFRLIVKARAGAAVTARKNTKTKNVLRGCVLQARENLSQSRLMVLRIG